MTTDQEPADASTARKHLLSTSSTPPTTSPSQTTNSASKSYGSISTQLENQRKQLYQQEDSLNSLSKGVRNVKSVAGAMEDEVKGHHDIIDQIEQGVDQGSSMAGDMKGRTKAVGRNSSGLGFREFCLLLWPLVLLLLVLFLVIKSLFR